MSPAARLPRTALDAGTQWPGWVPIPQFDDAALVPAWVEQVADVFRELWRDAWTDELADALRSRLVEAIDARALDPAHLVFEVWPVPSPVSCTVTAVAVPAEEVAGIWRSGAHMVPVRSESLGDGVHIGEVTHATGLAGEAFDIQSDAFVFADDDFAVAVSASDTVSHIMAYVRLGLGDIVQTLTLTREDGRPFAASLPPWLRSEGWHDGSGTDGPGDDGERGAAR